MAIEVAELETMRDALIRARAKGARELQLNGERIRYGSDAEMASAIADLDSRIARATKARPNRVSFGSSKGL